MRSKLTIQMLLWGMISTLSGITTNFAGMVATRFFLGFVEAAFLPGALLILSKVSWILIFGCVTNREADHIVVHSSRAYYPECHPLRWESHL